jgi:hypothetical protein
MKAGSLYIRDVSTLILTFIFHENENIRHMNCDYQIHTPTKQFS